MPSSTEDEVQVLHEGDFQAYANTIETAQYSEILAAWNQCVTDAGYALKAGENFSVDNTNMAEPEQKAAALAEARCHDQLGSIQQLADIMAGFEQEYITQHEAELQKVRDKAVAMVNRAKHILTAAKLDYLMEDR
jgi:hypothetical protein